MSSTPPCVSYKEATECGGPLDETGKTEVARHSRCGTIKIPSCSKALRAEHSPKFCSPSLAMVTSHGTEDEMRYVLLVLGVGGEAS
jgi:hypothetical protein